MVIIIISSIIIIDDNNKWEWRKLLNNTRYRSESLGILIIMLFEYDFSQVENFLKFYNKKKPMNVTEHIWTWWEP